MSRSTAKYFRHALETKQICESLKMILNNTVTVQFYLMVELILSLAHEVKVLHNQNYPGNPLSPIQ